MIEVLSAIAMMDCPMKGKERLVSLCCLAMQNVLVYHPLSEVAVKQPCRYYQ
jgi:hypothetical protein